MISKIRHVLWRILGIDYGQALKIHDYVFLKKDKYTVKGIGTYDNGALVFRWTKSLLKIGKYCSIANNVRFLMDEAYHNNSSITSYPLAHNLLTEKETLNLNQTFKQKEGICIGNDVWIGMNSIIMPNVKIGNGVTIAANSVVTKSFPDYCVIGGIPAKVLHLKYNDQQIKNLNEISWWNWDQSKLKDNIKQFYDLDIDAFIEKHLH